MRQKTARLLFPLALAAALAPAGIAKTTPKPVPPPEGTTVGDAAAAGGAFFESVNVDILNVEVYVTDKQGNAVKGLGIGDFEILEDRRPVKITNFYSVDDSSRKAPLPAFVPPVPAGPRPESLAASPEGPPEEQRLYLVVYIDNFNIKPFSRNRVFMSLRTFLDANVVAGDQVMLVTYNRSLKERVAFTTDPGLVNSTLREIEKETGFGVHRESERNDVLQKLEDAESAQQAIGQVRSYAGSLYNDISFSIDAIKEIVTSLGGLPGRKAVLYVSEGLPMVAAQDVFLALNEKFREASGLGLMSSEYDFSRRFQELSAQANANRVTFYTIDAGGLRTYSSVSAERQTAGSPGSAAFVDGQNIWNLQAPLRMMAEDTGGKAILNTNDVGPSLAAVASDLRTYYSLGYQPAHAGDGRYHRLEVKVKGEKERKLQVRHRTGYRDKPVEQRMNDGTVASLRFGGLANPLGIVMEFGTPIQREDGHSLVPLHLRIPLDKVTLVPQAQNQEGRLRAFIGVIDENGDESPVQVAPIPIQIPTADLEAARQKGWGYDLTLLMGQGRQKVAVGVRDDLGGVSSFVNGGIIVR